MNYKLTPIFYNNLIIFFLHITSESQNLDIAKERINIDNNHKGSTAEFYINHKFEHSGKNCN